MQTLFGKDYYVILRPSLWFNFAEYNDVDNIDINNDKTGNAGYTKNNKAIKFSFNYIFIFVLFWFEFLN